MAIVHDLTPGRLKASASARASGWVLLSGLCVLAAPTLVALTRQDWSTEQGQQGPLVLALGLWLIWRAWPQARLGGGLGDLRLAIAAACLAAPTYLLGRISDQIVVEAWGVYGMALATAYGLLGWGGLRSAGFPLLYLIFALPAPYTLVWTLTNHLRLWITEAVVATYQALGFSIVRDGLNIMVDQYVLAVKEACSGMNSLISLSAIGLLYLHLRRGPPGWYYSLLALPIVGFAILGNFTRVLVLVAVTHEFGDAIAQSYLHQMAGAVTFLTALGGVMALDAFAGRLLPRRREPS